MTRLDLDANRTFEATGHRATSADTDWAGVALAFFDRRNTVTIAGRTLNADNMRAIVQAPSQDARQALLRELIGAPHADYQDFKRFLDDVMVAQPASTGCDYQLTAAEARRVGVVDDGAETAYPAYGHVQVWTAPASLLSRSMTRPSGRELSPGELLAGALGSRATPLDARIVGLERLFAQGARSPAGSAAADFRQWVNSADYRKLTPELRHTAMLAVSAYLERGGQLLVVITALRSSSKDDGLAGLICELATSVDFVELPAPVATQILARLAATSRAPNERAALMALAREPAFAGMGSAAQLQLVRYVGCALPDIGESAAQRLLEMMHRPEFIAHDLAQRTTTLAAFMAADPPLATGSLCNPAFDAARRPFTVSVPEVIPDYAFQTDHAPAIRFVVHIADRDIAVVMPASRTSVDGGIMPIEQIARSLASLPTQSLAVVTAVEVSDHTNPQDTQWRVAYHWAAHARSFMACGAEGRIFIYPHSAATPPRQRDSDGTMVHETGHALSNRAFGALPPPPRTAPLPPGWASWSRAIQEDGGSPSGYARSDLPEDFSESLLLLTSVRNTPQEAEIRALFPHRCAILDALLARQ